jgi:hypothetical protein
VSELPPDPLPEIKPHCLANFVICPDGLILVVCVDCDSSIVGTACCKTEAFAVVVEHAQRMGTT